MALSPPPPPAGEQLTPAAAWLAHSERPGMIWVDSQSSTNQVALLQLQQCSYIGACVAPQQQEEGACVLASGGCRCTPTCSADCSCCVESGKGLAALKARGRTAGVVALLECGPACSCGPAGCSGRTTQQGVSVPVVLFWSAQKGWGVRAAQAVPRGAFVCEYAGEWVSAAEAGRRLAVYDADAERGHALLSVRLQLPSQTSSLGCCIDATQRGNLARFINHSCDGGNLEPVLTSCKGSLLLRVALFAAHGIAAGVELTYAYSHAAAGAGLEAKQQQQQSRRRCFCGTPACSGYLPSAV